jgi:hypothetical protein
MQMSRVITKPSNIEPKYISFAGSQQTGAGYVSLEECAQIALAYGEECAKSAQGYQSNQSAWESLFNSPEWGGKG